MATNQTNGLKRIGENLYVNDHGVYFAWFSMQDKQIKRSLRTEYKALGFFPAANVAGMACFSHVRRIRAACGKSRHGFRADLGRQPLADPAENC
jgi:hypothetical protein